MILFGITAILLIIFVTNFLLGLSFLDFYNQQEIRLAAADYINKNLKKNNSIGTYLYPNFYAPYVPLDYNKFNLISFRAHKELGEKISNNNPDYIVVEERGYKKEFIDYFKIRQNYKLIITFKRELKNFGPFKFSIKYKEPQATEIKIFKKK